MKHIWIYFFSFGLLMAGFSGFAQETATDSIAPKKNRYGLRLGTDLFKLSRTFYDNNYKGFEIVGDYRLTKKFYLAAEIGSEDKTTDEPQLNFTTKGTYLRVGIDFNAYENWLDMENQIYVGLRYGTSVFSQNLNHYSIYQNTNGFLGEHTLVNANQEFSGLSAHWAEFLGGIKAEIFNNLYVGFSVRLHFLIADKQPENFENLYIPGFHRTYDGSFGVGFNYTVSYFIPLYKN
ncbi:MAG: DUF6048 family protein [Flavobacteriaceae bacterium]